MTVPSASDIRARKKKLEGFRKKIGPDGKPSEKATLNVVRGAIRQAWMKSDVKLAFLYSRTIPDMDDSTRTKWLYQCEICKNLFRDTEVEVDHRHGNHTFTKVADFEGYFNNILMVSEADLQLLCKDNPKNKQMGCHGIKTLSESHNLSWDDAKAYKLALAVSKKKAAHEIDFLKKHGYVPASNAKLRFEQLFEHFKGETK